MELLWSISHLLHPNLPSMYLFCLWSFFYIPPLFPHKFPYLGANSGLLLWYNHCCLQDLEWLDSNRAQHHIRIGHMYGAVYVLSRLSTPQYIIAGVLMSYFISQFSTPLCQTLRHKGFSFQTFPIVPNISFSQWDSWVLNIRESKKTLKGISTFPWSLLTGDLIIKKCLIAWCLKHDLLCDSMAQNLTLHWMCSYLSPTCSRTLYFDPVEEMEIVKRLLLDGMGWWKV